MIKLPEPKHDSDTSVEEAMFNRHSVRSYKKDPLTINQVSQLLWSAQGKNKHGTRTAPSAGALYPLEVYIVVGKDGVKELEAGVYHYNLKKHSLELVKEGDMRSQLRNAALFQSYVAKAPVDIVIAGIYSRTTGKYGDRGVQYVHIEVGHVAQNVYLQCQSLGLGTVYVGAFGDENVQKVLGLDKDEIPFAILPVGKV